ncbi:MAG: response regulator [Anaerolineae bacterium]|nr:response regulator [Anaerolineae bacterium]
MATILIIEDDEQFQDLLQMALERHGHNVLRSLNGVDALYQASYHQPDLIILDLMMPWASGDAVLGFIRSTDQLKDIPVLVLSAHPNGESLARQLEADGFLAKPVSMVQFYNYVNTLLSVSVPQVPGTL